MSNQATPTADRPVDDWDVWMTCRHEWKSGQTYANWTREDRCIKCGLTYEKDVS